MTTRPRERRLLVGAAAVAVAVPAVAFWYAGHRVDTGLEPALSAAAGAEVTVDTVEVDLDGTLRLEGLDIEGVARADAVEASVGLGSLLAGAVRPDEVRIEGPHLHVTVDDDGRSNLERLARHVAGRRASRRASGAPSAARRPSLRRVIVTGGDLVVDLGSRGSLTLRRLEARPREGGVRLLFAGGQVDLASHGVTVRGELGRASADLALPSLSPTRALAVGSSLVVDTGDGEASLRDVVLAHRTDRHGDSRMQARVPRAGADGRLSLRVPPSRDRVAIELDAVPLRALARFVPAGVDLSHATATGRAAARVGLDGLHGAFEGQVRHAAIDDPRVARAVVELDADLVVAAQRHGDSLVVDQLRVHSGAIDLTASGRLDGRGTDATGRVRAELARAPCSELIASLPLAMRDRLAGMRMTGTAAARVDLDFSRRDDRETHLDVDIDVGSCRVRSEPAAADPRVLERTFEHRFPNGVHASIGDEDDYAALRSLPSYIPNAWVAAEDAAFFRHRGFDLRQIERSLAIDLRAGGFVRGGSTISQQLVKNVFLSHERTLARKLQEAVLTWRLEAHVPKKLILERYLNIIELGPGIYGLPAAARYWFDKPARALTVAETAFLVALTPEPQSASRRISAAGKLDPDTAARVRVILRHMRRRGAISNAAYQRARKQPPTLAQHRLARAS